MVNKKIDFFFKKRGSQDIEVNATTKPSTDNVEASIPEQRPCKVPRIESKEIDTSSLLLVSYDGDVADVVLHKAPQNASYYSHRIQKEILSIFFDKIQRFIREEIDEAKFCIIVNEARDESKREQMAIVLRFFYKDSFIKEHFFYIVHVSDTTSATLKEEICIVLSRHNLSVQNIRGQGYDGASNMRGEWTGLQALFLHDCHFVHDQLKVAQTKEIAAKLAIDEVETVLSNVINDRAISTQHADADGVYDKITSFEFVFILHLMRDIMGTTNDFCQALQHIPDMSARYTSGRGRACHQTDHITIEHHFRVDIFTIICDSQLQELNNRFTEDVMELLILSSALNPRDDYNLLIKEDILAAWDKRLPGRLD
ncbi:uncharacterized protein LOC114302698 [Camellia sinensis]|uniref:uncharacterized protein LOC114302698 n=1 Tax=Camellia sinensis TaxID=4442 RepID=UPI001035E3AE|nr:uncharacterized protein LOC114302698 [Camellia sinensis]